MMRTRAFAYCLAGVVFATAVPSHAEDLFAHTRRYAAATGQEVRIGAYAKFDRRCQPNGYPTITVTAPPEHGSVATRPTTHKVRETLGTGSCNGRLVAALGVYYTSAADFHGSDTLQLMVQFSGSHEIHDTVIVTVQ